MTAEASGEEHDGDGGCRRPAAAAIVLHSLVYTTLTTTTYWYIYRYIGPMVQAMIK